MDIMIRRIGAVPVRMAPPEIFESMQRGTIDAAMLPYQSVLSYDLTNLLRAGTSGVDFGTIALTYSIGENKWRQLPEDVKKALLQAAETISRSGCDKVDAAEAAATDKARSTGMKLVRFDTADQKQFETIFSGVREDWAKDLDKRGKPGSAILAEFMSALRGTK
jgi:TRAP-type C4-dicarboxylate transport system substrate-binding protein